MTYTRNQVSEAVNAGADLVTSDIGDGERDTDLVNLVVNAIMTVLDSPDVSLDDVIESNYSVSPEEVRSWWSGWS